MDPLKSIAMIAASGMHVQSTRLQVVAENVANADSTGATPEADPYRRKTISVEEVLDQENGLSTVKVSVHKRSLSKNAQRHILKLTSPAGKVRNMRNSGRLQLKSMPIRFLKECWLVTLTPVQ